MNCPACGMDVPDSSHICPYCETILSEDNNSQNINSPPSDIPENDRSKKRSLAPIIMLASACVLLIGICISLSNSREAEISAKNRELAILRQSGESLSQQILELNEKIGILNEEVAALEDEKNSLTQKISDLSTENSALLSLGPYYYDQLYTEFSSGNIGYASDTYYADEGIVYMSSYETERTITITAQKYNTTLFWRRTLGNAEMDWNDWIGSTTSVTITSNGTGVSSFTFTNDKDSDTFKIIVVVAD